MAREKGKLKVSNKLGGKVKIGKKTYNIPKIYDLSPRERFNNKDCEFEFEDGSIVAVFFNGQELPKDTEAEKRKTERIKKRQEEELRLQKEQEEKKKNDRIAKEHGNDSFNIKKAFCPKDTSDLNIQAYQVDNFLLKFKRFARFAENEKDYSKSKFEFYKRDRRGNIDFQIISKYGNTDFQAIASRAKMSAESLLGKENCYVLENVTSGRLITGLGGASVYEIDITLHHIYGFPYIPSSSIKGVVRSWIITNVFDNDEKKAWKESKVFCEMFGCPKESIFEEELQGNILFFDAYPTQPPKVVPDIMTPHYGKYYGDSDNKKNIAPTDTQMPVPIPFLTVDKKTPFQFILGSKKLDWDKWLIQDKTITQWLKDALTNHGIGAKTAVGYGYMKE